MSVTRILMNLLKNLGKKGTIPIKSKGVPGVSTGSRYKRNISDQLKQEGGGGMSVDDLYSRGIRPQRMRQLNPNIAESFKRLSPNLRKTQIIDKLDRQERVMQELGGLKPAFFPKAGIRDRILQMRKDPGIAQGLGKMKGRAYSSLNQPGSVVAGTKRSFANMLRTDKNFENFVVDMVGSTNVAKVMNSPQMRRTLLRDYQRVI